MSEILFRKPQAAEYLTVSLRSLEEMMHAGTGPRFFKMGRSVRFRQSALDAWIDDQPSFSSTSQAAKAG